jgi:sugar lactone lactonase YvrE
MQTKPTVFLSLAFAVGAAACTASPGLPSRQTTPELALPGAAYYPESLTVGADGTLYVGSLGGGGIVRIRPTSETADPFVAGSTKNVAGVYVDDEAKLLYVCENDFTSKPAVVPQVAAYRLSDGQQANVYPFPQAGVCNDMVLDGGRNLYVTDSGGRIYVLRPGSSALAVFSADPVLAPSMAGGFGADGIVWDDDAALLVNLFSDSRLLRVQIRPDGSAGEITPITVTPALQNPDGMRLLDARTVVLVEGAGRVTQLSINGAAATGKVLADGLDSPTSLAVTKGAYWVTEGQLGHFLGLVAGPPTLPFHVRRVDSH